MYKMIVHRYGAAYLEEDIKLESLIELGNHIELMGEGFVECYLDENDTILSDDSLQNVIGIEYNSRAGEKYDISGIDTE